MGVQGGTRGEFVIKAAIPPPHWGLWSALRPSASPPHLSTSSSLSHPAWDPCLLTVLPLQPSDSHLSQSSLALNSALLKRIPHLHVWVPWSYIFICGSILICITFLFLCIKNTTDRCMVQTRIQETGTHSFRNHCSPPALTFQDSGSSWVRLLLPSWQALTQVPAPLPNI